MKNTSWRKRVARAGATSRAVTPLLVLAAIVLGCATDAGAQAPGAHLVRLTLSRAGDVVRLGGTLAVRALGDFDDGTLGVDLTSAVKWRSSNPLVATATGGVVTGVAVGEARIRALDPVTDIHTEPADGLTRVVASLAAITVLPPKRVLPVKRTTGYRAIGTFEDGVTLDITADVDMSIAEPSIAALQPGPRARGLLPGTTAVRAVDRETGISSSASRGDGQLTVVPKLTDLEISPESLAVPLGGATDLKARASFAGDCEQYTYTRRVSWVSSDTSTATVSRGGRVRCRADGAVVISVYDRDTGITSTASDADAAVVCGRSLVGIDVSPRQYFLPVGEVRELRAIYRFSDGSAADGSRNVVWESSDPSVVAIGVDGDTGEGQALAPGQATIVAYDPARNVSSEDPGGTSGSFEVRAAVDSFWLSPASPPGGTLLGLPGTTIGFSANVQFLGGPTRRVNKLAAWTTSDPAIVGLDDDSPCYVAGTARLLAVGTATVAATYPADAAPGAKTASVDIEVVPEIYGSPSRAFLAPPTLLID